MKTIIDRNFEGIKSVGSIYEIDAICVDGDLEIVVPLKVGEWLKVGESLEVGEWLKVGGSLEVGEWLKVGGSLEVGGWLEVGGSLEVGEWLKVGESLEVGEEMFVFGVKTFFSIAIETGAWKVFLTSNVLKIGCEKHSVKEWADFSDKEISAMDTRATEFWNTWKDVIFKLHANLTKENGK